MKVLECVLYKGLCVGDMLLLTDQLTAWFHLLVENKRK